MKAKGAAELVAAVVTVAMLTIAPVEAHTASDESQLASLVNRERGARGVSALSVRSDLSSIARRHSQEMASEGRIYHNGNTPNEVSGNWSRIGENVGRGSSVERIHDAFMDSSGHRAHILDAGYNELGVGVAARDGTLYVTELFVRRGSAPKRVQQPAPRPAKRPVRTARVRHRPPPPPPPPPKVEAPPIEPAIAHEVAMLLRLLAFDADVIDPTTGWASGV